MIMKKVRYAIFQFLENPRSSMGAKVMSIVSATFVLVSLAGNLPIQNRQDVETYSGLILSSMPEFQTDKTLMTPHWTLSFLEIL